MNTLPFDPTWLKDLVLRLNAVMAKQGTVFSDLGGNASDDPLAVSMQVTKGDLSRDEITQEIESLNDEQKDGLIALFWIGRGDRAPADWEQSKELARERHVGLVSTYLLAQPHVGEFLTAGLEKVQQFRVDSGGR